MEQFRIPAPLRDLTDSYPETRLVLEVTGGGEQARRALARLWLSEGIPHAFRKCPAVYDSVRCWLSACLRDHSVHAKDIGIVGSARLGASFVPAKLGKPFSSASDLDLFIVSKRLFEVLKEEFYQWSREFENKEVDPIPGDTDRWWKNNSDGVPRNIKTGFLDVKKIPSSVRTKEGKTKHYSVTRRINLRMEQLPERLKRTLDAPKPKEASVRCYKSWDCFVSQKSLNLRTCWEVWGGKQGGRRI